MNDDRPGGIGNSTSGRVADLLFGILFLVLAAAILFLSERFARVGAIVAAVTVGGIGIEAIYCAWRGKRSLLARIGPLP